MNGTEDRITDETNREGQMVERKSFVDRVRQDVNYWRQVDFSSIEGDGGRNCASRKSTLLARNDLLC